MDEEEIDSWYEEEKQKCMDDYLKDIEAKKDYDEAENRYNGKLNKLIDKYNKLMAEKLQNRKAGKLRNFISNIKSKIYLFKGK